MSDFWYCARINRPVATVHSGAAADFLRRHRAEAQTAAFASPKDRQQFVNELFGRLVDTRNLYAAFAHIRTQGGDGPGIDGLSPAHIDAETAWEMTRMVRAILLDGTYRPARVRKKKIKKSSGNGYRTLSIPTLIDRVVQRALVQVIEPLLDPHFSDDSFGYRHKRGRYQALARAQWHAVGGRRVWITEDCENAFDSVPQQRLLNVVWLHLPDDRLFRLINLLITTRTGRGIPQGGPASGLLLNLYLDHFLDRPWCQRNPKVPLIRVADDLLPLCRDVEEARQAYSQLDGLLRPTGMRLKGTPQNTIRDLAAGQIVEWLGYRISCPNGRLTYDIADRAWRNLALKLTVAHEKPLSPLVAQTTISGWTSQIGPAYDESRVCETYTRLLATAREAGFEEIPTAIQFHMVWRHAHENWMDAWGKNAADGLRIPKWS